MALENSSKNRTHVVGTTRSSDNKIYSKHCGGSSGVVGGGEWRNGERFYSAMRTIFDPSSVKVRDKRTSGLYVLHPIVESKVGGLGCVSATRNMKVCSCSLLFGTLCLLLEFHLIIHYKAVAVVLD